MIETKFSLHSDIFFLFTEQETSERTRTSGAQPNIPGVNLGNGFDLGAALNNPAIIQMATQMISEPAMQNL